MVVPSVETILALSNACRSHLSPPVRSPVAVRADRSPQIGLQEQVVGLGHAHPDDGWKASDRSRTILATIAANNSRGTATSASWNVTYFECRTTLAPILMSFSRNVVNDQWRILLGTAKRPIGKKHRERSLQESQTVL